MILCDVAATNGRIAVDSSWSSLARADAATTPTESPEEPGEAHALNRHTMVTLSYASPSIFGLTLLCFIFVVSEQRRRPDGVLVLWPPSAAGVTHVMCWQCGYAGLITLPPP